MLRSAKSGRRRLIDFYCHPPDTNIYSRALKTHCQERYPAEHENALQRFPPRVVEDD